MSDARRGASLQGAVDLSALVNRAQQPAAAEAADGGAPAGASAPASRLVVDVDDRSFSDLVELSQQVPVVVDLWASWSEESTRLSATLIKLAIAYQGRFVLARVEIERSPQLAMAFQAQQVPTVAAVIGGRPVGLFVGELPEGELRDAIDQVLAFAAQNGVTGTVPVDDADAGAEAGEPEPAPLPPLHQEAYDAIERGDLDAAAAAFGRALQENPADSDAELGLAQVGLMQRTAGADLQQARAAAAAAPTDIDAQTLVADLDLLGGHVEDAFLRLIDLVRVTSGEDRERVRTHLLELFSVVGPHDERVRKARTALMSALF
jgi:putative thioredoxin